MPRLDLKLLNLVLNKEKDFLFVFQRIYRLLALHSCCNQARETQCQEPFLLTATTHLVSFLLLNENLKSQHYFDLLNHVIEHDSLIFQLSLLEMEFCILWKYIALLLILFDHSLI